MSAHPHHGASGVGARTGPARELSRRIRAVKTRAELLPLVANGLNAVFNAAAAAVVVQLAEDLAEIGVIRRQDSRYRQITFPLQGENVLIRTLRAGRVINLPAAAAADIAHIPYLDKPGGHPVLAIPFTTADTPRGVFLILADAARGGFSPEEEQLGSNLAEETQSALATLAEKETLANDADRLRWENRQLQLALDTPLLAALTDPDVILERLLDEIRKGLEFDRGAIYGYDEATRSVRQIATSGYLPEEAKLAADNFAESPGFRVVQNGEPLLIADPLQEGAATLDGDMRAGSYMAVPVKIEGRVVAVITLANSQRGGFEHGDLRFVSILANHAGIALKNASRLEGERKRALQLGLLNEIGKKILLTKSPAEIYTEIAAALKDKFGYYHVAIYSVDPARDELHLETITGGYADILPVGFRQKTEEGLLGAAVRERRSIMVNDVMKESRFLAVNPRAMQTKSELCTPVFGRGDVVAVIDIQSRRTAAFEESDILALETLADQIGVTLENAALFREERQRAGELALVNRLGKQILAARELPTLLATVAATVRKHFKFYNVAIFLKDPLDPTLLVPGALDGAYEKAPGIPERVAVGRGFVGIAAEKGEIVYSNDATRDARYVPDPFPGDQRSEAAIPIKLGDAVVGVLDAQKNQKNALAVSDLELLQTFADQVAIAIQNVKLLSAEQRATHDAQTLLHISHIISQTTDLDKSLEFLVEETAVVMNADGAALVLLDADEEPTILKTYAGFTSEKEETETQSSFNLARYRFYADVAAGAKPFFIPDTAADHRITPDFLPGVTVGAVLATPIRKKNRLLGVLLAAWAKPSPEIVREDFELLEAIAFQAAIGIENLLYFENLNRQTKYLSILSSIAADASRLPPLEELLHIALQKILVFAGLPGGAIHLYDAKRATLNLAARMDHGPATENPWSAFEIITRERAAKLLNADVVSAERAAGDEAFGFPPPDQGGPAAFISIPLVAKQHIHGRMTLWAWDPWTFVPEDVSLIQTICDEISIYIENTQLFAQTSGQMKELYTLIDTTKTLASSLDTEEIIYSIAQKVKNLIGADECTVFLLDRDAGTLDPIVSLTAYPEEVMKLQLKVGEGITGHVALTGVGEYVNDAHSDHRSVTVPGTPAEDRESLLCVPLIAREEVIGVMTLGRTGAEVFTDRELQLLTLFAGQVAGSIENARLFDRLLSSISVAEEHRRKLDAIFTSISDGIIVTDTGLRVIEVNPAAERILGRSAAEIVNRHVRSIIESPALHEIFEEARSRLEEEAVAEFEFAARGHEPDEAISYYRVLVDAVVGTQGEKVGFVATFRDITETKLLGTLKENFISNVSHELRTPLTSIIGSAELILDDEKAKAFPYYKFVGIIDSQARRLRDLVESILDFSLLESGRLELALEPVDLRDIITETVRRYKPLADEAAVRLNVNLVNDVPVTYADPRLLETVFSNLIKNGIRFNYTGGSVDIGLSAKEREAVITVGDSGSGIPNDQLENIFSQFYQVDSSSTRAVGGTGLGLAITKRAVEAHGGRINVSSVVGQGSVFTVYLPLQAPPTSEEPRAK